MQFSRLHLYSNNNRVLWDASASTLSSFDSFAAAGEKSLNIVKNTGIDKWCVPLYGIGTFPPIPVVIDNLSTVNINAYAYVTANDFDARDPVSWTFETSIDNSNWELVGSRTDESVTTLRDISTELFPLPSSYSASPLMFLAC